MRALSSNPNKKKDPAAGVPHGAEGVSDMDSNNNETFIAFHRTAQP
jgi:hypothetical protein